MTKEEIIAGIKDSVIRVSDIHDPALINNDDTLRKYIRPNVKNFFVAHIVHRFPMVPFNEFSKAVFTKIITVNDLIDYIQKLYIKAA